MAIATNPYTELLDVIQNLYGSTATAVSKEAIALGNRNATTGWRAITYTETSITAVILPRGRGFNLYPPGFHATNDYEAFSATALQVGDQFKDAANNYYLVTNYAPYKAGGATIQYYAYDLKLLSEWQALSGSTTWNLTRSPDPRTNMKTYINTYARNAQITKDDDSTTAAWNIIFNDPPYPLHLEFRHGTTPMNGLYVVDQPNSTPERSYDKSIAGYMEHCPVHICTVDSTGCAGWALAWKMEEELRYILETQPFGSYRSMEKRSKKDVDIGGMWMYDNLFEITYVRSTTE